MIWPDEAAAHAALSWMLVEAGGGRFPGQHATLGQALGKYLEVADLEVSTLPLISGHPKPMPQGLLYDARHKNVRSLIVSTAMAVLSRPPGLARWPHPDVRAEVSRWLRRNGVAVARTRRRRPTGRGGRRLARGWR